MEIRLDRNPFFPQVTGLLKEMNQIGFFPYGMLIGSWPSIANRPPRKPPFPTLT
jgi:hypothetical protein